MQDCKLLLAVAILYFPAISTSAKEPPSQIPKIMRVQKIWDAAPHNAFTDLVRWRGKFYCAFREGKHHAGDLGNLRIIASEDGDDWTSMAVLTMAGHDLRDAALSVTPDNRLMVLGGAQKSLEGRRTTGTIASFSSTGEAFSTPKLVMPLGQWLWRVTWYGDTAYGVAYRDEPNEPYSTLVKTNDGLNFETIVPKLLNQGGWATEARLRFGTDGRMFCLHRRDGQPNSAYLGNAAPPYETWTWRDTEMRIGGPNFVRSPSGKWIAAGRTYSDATKTSLMSMDMDGALQPLFPLPSGGDTSYPGMVWHQDRLWVSYYSSHSGKAAIYLAVMEWPDGEAYEIGHRRELFVDRKLIHSLDRCELRLHQPIPAESVLEFDRPWEGPFCGYATVLKDKNSFRLYYRGLPEAGGDGTDAEVTCYAASDNGVDWKKPDLGVYEIGGTRNNNVVLSGESPASHNFSPFIDTNPIATAEERYKALGGTEKGLFAFASGDGIHWRKMAPNPVFTQGVFDSQNVAYYSPTESRYVCYFRTWSQGGYQGFRTVSRTTSTDFVQWTEAVPMRFGETPQEHLYTNQTTPYFRAPHLGISIAARFHPGRQVLSSAEAMAVGVNPKYFGDISDSAFMSTRGGDVYDRTHMESFIRPGNRIRELGLPNELSGIGNRADERP